jgi:DNA modification methylase
VIHVGDCLAILPTLPADSVDAIVTDPPYHLTTGKKGGTGVASDNPNSPAGRARIGTGFMGMAWDGGDVAMRSETWAAALRVAKPGAYLVAFGGTRTFHRMACAIEDAGWELRDVLSWLYGSGFPKSLNGPWGGTALKPAWEPIILARKPVRSTVEACWREHGTGALNIDGCRIEGEKPLMRAIDSEARNNPILKTRSATGTGETSAQGRWPANVLHDGSDEVLAAFPAAAPGQKADVPVDSRTASRNVYNPMARGAHEASATRRYADRGGTNFAPLPGARRGDSGSAARFFYSPKADRADRDHGMEGVPASMVHGPSGDGRCWDIPGSKSAPKANNHPTVKPHDLMRWLCRLVTPPGGLVLDPFTGSGSTGSTGRAALAEGFRFVGIELDATYAAIAERRIHATQPGLALGVVHE